MAKRRNYGDAEGGHPFFDARTWEISALVLAFLTLLITTLAFTYYTFQASTFVKGLFGFLFGVASLSLSFFLGMVLRNWTASISEYFVYFLIGCIATFLVVSVGFAGDAWLLYFSGMLLFVLLQTFFVGCILSFFAGQLATFGIKSLILWLLLIIGVPTLDVWLIYWLNQPGELIEVPTDLSPNSDPSARGGLPFEELAYGHWAASSDSTAAFDASGFEISSNWLHKLYWEQYCDFDFKTLPLQGKLFYPATSDTVPLVVILAGQHYLEASSASGMTYLAEHFASNGFASLLIDLDYLDRSWAGGLKGETKKLKASLISENLLYFKEWLTQKDSILSSKVDWKNTGIAAMGSSNLAVAELIANQQANTRPSINTKEIIWPIDFKTWIAIAPDPKLSIQPFNLRRLHYLSIAGSHDEKFPGTVAYKTKPKLSTEDSLQMVVGSYLQGANHAQFNTSWRKTLLPFPDRWLIDRTGMLPAPAQRKALKGLALSFVRATLLDRQAPKKLFYHPETLPWLPILNYSTVFERKNTIPLLSFEEDPNPLTTTLPGGRIVAKGFLRWHETDQYLPDFLPNNQQLILKWDIESEFNSATTKTVPELQIMPPTSFLEQHQVSPATALLFSLAWLPFNKQEAVPEKPDFSIIFIDSLNIKTRVAFSNLGKYNVKDPVKILRAPYLMEKFEETANLPITQTYSLPFNDIIRINPNFDFGSLKQIKLSFDRSPKGKILIDNIQMYQLDEYREEE